VRKVNFQKNLSNRSQNTQDKLHSFPSKLVLITNIYKWQIRISSKTPAIEIKIEPEATFFHVHVLTYLSIATIFASFVESVAPVKIVNFEDYPTIATRGIARRFIIVQTNCTLYVADYNYKYSVYSECTCNEGWIFRKNSTKAAKIQPSSYTAVQLTDINFNS